jgi:exopolyphosphatase/guanosine-5'-triphosphate,3'-diphosphate pyrophosphatase
MAKRTAVIDLGSNSVRMMIYEKSSRFAFSILHQTKSRVRISEGTFNNKAYLQDQPMQRTLLALGEFMTIIKSYRVKKILAVATSAVRDAPNGKKFVNLVKKELGLSIKIIDGQKEAYLGGIACANLLSIKKSLMVDIGGGSSEFALIENKKVTQTFSIPLGTVRLKELFFDKNNNKNKQILIEQELAKLPKEFYNIPLIGVGGTIRALSKQLKKQENYPLEKIHGFTYNAKQMLDFIEKILITKNEELKKFDFKKDRLDVIQPGSLIFLNIIKKLNAPEIISSGVGIREGLYLSDLLRTSRDQFPANFNISLRNTLDKFDTLPHETKKLNAIALNLFDTLKDRLKIDEAHRLELSFASKLFNVGKYIHFYSKERQSIYLALNTIEYGLTHTQIATIVSILKLHHKHENHTKFFDRFRVILPNIDILKKLSYILKLAEALSCVYYEKNTFTLNINNNILYIHLPKKNYILAKQKLEKIDCKLGEIKLQIVS